LAAATSAASKPTQQQKKKATKRNAKKTIGLAPAALNFFQTIGNMQGDHYRALN
jgi:hypothetical protein